MINIIQNGKERIFFTRCDKCASELEYQHEDVHERQPECSSYIYRHIICPVCGHEVSVNLTTKLEQSQGYSAFGCCPSTFYAGSETRYSPSGTCSGSGV